MSNVNEYDSPAGLDYLDHMFGKWSKDGVENKVIQVSMLTRTVVAEIDEVFNVIVRPNESNFLDKNYL